ncbi:MAG: META domain-containing protein [Cyclobacteriaceae bacterium]|nr:META domain-containing protein [Cyclobacteriaceae bacterium]UYN85978.1 MAG: META domain-containing protein [Cyclobacteriaceae bacterium]
MNKLLVSLLAVTLFIGCKPDEPSITEVDWKLTLLNGKDYASLQQPITITFSPDNKVAGHAGCNRYFGSYKKSQAELSFSQMGATKMFCDGKMEIEDSFLKALAEVDRFVVSENKLRLQKGERILMEFAK